MITERTRTLVRKVANFYDIKSGTLAELVTEARVIVAQSRTNLEHVKAELTYTQTREDLDEIAERRRTGKWFASHAAYSEAVRVCAG